MDIHALHRSLDGRTQAGLQLLRLLVAHDDRVEVQRHDDARFGKDAFFQSVQHCMRFKGRYLRVHFSVRGGECHAFAVAVYSEIVHTENTLSREQDTAKLRDKRFVGRLTQKFGTRFQQQFHALPADENCDEDSHPAIG